ncbi:MAG TPA: T9SS type A sorting domain-containing protein, partial [Bacteroidia bacterium]|nr:T9SS type A sorting domain-containing protein [Bacteroidia bacterium]
TKGNIVSDTTNLLCMRAGSVVTGAADTSFVEGPVKKFGNTAFVFPTGKDSTYRAVEITAPSVITDAFTAEYFDTGQPMGEDLDSSLAYMDECNYFNLTRKNGSSNVYAYFNWNSSHCEIADTGLLKIAYWQDTIWVNKGHGLITGNYSSGKIKTENVLTTYGNFVFAYDTSIIHVPTPEDYLSGGGFVINQGQLLGTDTLPHPEILYYGNAGNTTLYLGDSVFYYSFAKSSIDSSISDSLQVVYKTDTVFRMNMKLIGRNAEVEIVPSDTSQGFNNYYLGYLDTAVTHALTYQEIKYENVYDGIDLAFHNGDEFRFNVNADGDPDDIKFYYKSVDSTKIDGEDGSLNLYTPLGYKKYVPQAYEYVDDVWNAFEVNMQKTDSVVSFSLGTHESGVPIILKLSSIPVVAPIKNNLKWSTFYGGIGTEHFSDTYIDDADYVYATGYNEGGFFPIFNAIQPNNAGSYDAVVVKFFPARNRVFSTYYGGSTYDFGTAITKDNANNVIFAGYTNSINFPDCPTCFGNYNQTAIGGGTISHEDGFIVKLTSTGNLAPGSFGMSTYYGGTQDERILSIATDQSSNIFVGGVVGSTTLSYNIPLPPGGNSGLYYQNFRGIDDGFIAKFNSGNNLVWSTHLGGDNSATGFQGEMVQSITTDFAGNLYVLGLTQSNATSITYTNNGLTSNTSLNDFQICGPQNGVAFIEANTNSSRDYFVCKFNSSSKLLWSTMFGGDYWEGYYSSTTSPWSSPRGIAASSKTASIYITGNTPGSSSFPIQSLSTSNWNVSTMAGQTDAFISRFDREYELIWSTYYGGSNFDDGKGLALNNNDYLYVVGNTFSDNFPTLPIAFQSFYHGDLNDPVPSSLYSDGFILKFNRKCNRIYGTYFGGELDDNINSLAFQKDNHNLVVVGSTTSPKLPVQDFAGSSVDYYDPFYSNVALDAFVSNLYNSCTLCREEDGGENIFEAVSKGNIIIYPNPSTGELFIKSTGSEIRSVHIMDLMGKMVYSNKKVSVTLYKGDLSVLNEGVYIAVVELSDGNIFRNKIIIAH